MATEVTLTAAMRSNLVSLQQTNALLGRTQERLATGKKVNTALDNPVNYFAAAAHLQRADNLTARKDGMNEAVQAIKAANTGIEGVKTLLSSANGLLESARSTTGAANLSALQTQFNQVMSQINKLVSDSGYKGTNFLGSAAAVNQLDVLFNESGTNKLTITGFDARVAQLAANLGTATGITFSLAAKLNSLAAGIVTATTKLQAESSKLSSNLSIINARLDFTSNIVNVEKTGADNLTLADTNEEGANMLILQTRNQLGTTSLSLASQAAQSVLRLF